MLGWRCERHAPIPKHDGHGRDEDPVPGDGGVFPHPACSLVNRTSKWSAFRYTALQWEGGPHLQPVIDVSTGDDDETFSGHATRQALCGTVGFPDPAYHVHLQLREGFPDLPVLRLTSATRVAGLVRYATGELARLAAPRSPASCREYWCAPVVGVSVDAGGVQEEADGQYAVGLPDARTVLKRVSG